MVSGQYMTDRQRVHQDVYFIPMMMMMMIMTTTTTTTTTMMMIILLLYPRVYIVDVLAVCVSDLSVFPVSKHPQNEQGCLLSCDPDFDPMTFIYEFDIDILKLHMPTKMNFLGQDF